MASKTPTSGQAFVLTVDLFRVPSLSQSQIEWLSWPLASKVRQAGPSGHLNQRSCGQWQQKGTGSHWSYLVRGAIGILQSSWSTKYHPSLSLENDTDVLASKGIKHQE